MKDLDVMSEEVKQSELAIIKEAATILYDEMKSTTPASLLTSLKMEFYQNRARTLAVVGYFFGSGTYDGSDGRFFRKFFKGDGGYHKKYHKEKSIEEYKNMVKAFVLEFGRPGTSATTMRDRRPKGPGLDYLGRKIGRVPPKGHIRVAWFRKKEKVIDCMETRFLELVNKLWNKAS
jgi:hypothetical protein